MGTLRRPDLVNLKECSLDPLRHLCDVWQNSDPMTLAEPAFFTCRLFDAAAPTTLTYELSLNGLVGAGAVAGRAFVQSFALELHSIVR